MSPTEVVAEAIKDLPALRNKLKDPLARLQRRVKVDPRIRDQVKLFPYRSHAGNNWLVAVRGNKKMVCLIPFVYYHCPDGKLRAARICHPGLSMHFSGHMLDQYFARFNRTAGKVERLKEFILENMDLGVESCLDNDEVRIGAKHGYIIGRWEVRDMIMQLTTFVDHGKLFQEQLEQMDRLDQQRCECASSKRNQGQDYRTLWPSARSAA